jgi:hypothetical protein
MCEEKAKIFEGKIILWQNDLQENRFKFYPNG